MRSVDDARNSRVDTSQRSDEIADIHVMRAVVKRESLMGRRHVLRDIAVWNDATENSLPGVTMAVYESWNHDRIRCIDDLACRLEIDPYGCYFLSLDQHITFGQIADLWIHAEDCSAFQQNSAVRVRTRNSLDYLGFLAAAF